MNRARVGATGALLLGLAALVAARDLGAPFDRGVEGWQGSFHAIGAVNLERYGPAATRGYPPLVVDGGALPPRPDGAPDARAAAEALVYANHPPTVPLLAWAGARALGPPGWADAWRADRAPEGLEPALRAPFLALHLLGLALLGWAVAGALGARAGLVATAVGAFAPCGVLYASLVNVETAVLPPLLLAAGALARLGRGADGRWLAVCAGGSFAAGAVTWAPLLFAPPLVAWVACAHGRRTAALSALALGAAAVPLALHAAFAPAGLGATGPLARARELWAPLLDGTGTPVEWLAQQARNAAFAFGPLLAVVAGAGLVAARRGAGLALAAGAALALAAFWKHTLDAQYSFQLLALPAVAFGAAWAVDRAAERLARGAAPGAPGASGAAAAACAALLLAPGLVRAERARAERRAPNAPGALPLPDATGAALAALAPPGTTVLVPDALGLNLAPAYYAWRHVLGAPSPDAAPPLVDAPPLAGTPRWYALPDAAPDAARAVVAAQRARLVAERGAPVARAAGWSAWELAPARVARITDRR